MRRSWTSSSASYRAMAVGMSRPDGTEAPEELVSAIAEFRHRPIGEITVDDVEITLLDIDSDYPEPETLARIPIGEAISR